MCTKRLQQTLRQQQTQVRVKKRVGVTEWVQRKKLNIALHRCIEFISSALALVILKAVVAVVEREQQPVEELLRTAVRWQVELG